MRHIHDLIEALAILVADAISRFRWLPTATCFLCGDLMADQRADMCPRCETGVHNTTWGG